MSVILHRRGTETEWDSVNPILGPSEIGYVTSGTNAGRFKIGNGVSTWSALVFANPGSTGVLPATSGGTGQSTYAVGDLLVGDTSNTLSRTADIATGNVLLSGGVGIKPNYGKVGLTTHVSGTLPVGNGGTGATTFTSGSYLQGAGTSAITAQVGIPAGDITSGVLPYARFPPGMVVNFNQIRTESRASYGFNGDTIISQLNIGITPRFSNSLLLVQWSFNYESGYNAVFRIYRDGSLIQTSGYKGFNSLDGNNWSGYSPAQYDTNTATTPNPQSIQYVVPAGSTNSTTLQLAIRSSGSSNESFFLNRSFDSSGSVANEIGVSSAVIWEISQ